MFKSVSPSRTYVAMCNNSNFVGFHFKKFVLPANYSNDSESASWYFLNHLDSFSCINGCFAIEDYNNLTDAKQDNKMIRVVCNHYKNQPSLYELQIMSEIYHRWVTMSTFISLLEGVRNFGKEILDTYPMIKVERNQSGA